MMLDRKYAAGEVAEIAMRGTTAMKQDHVPETVVLAAHVAAANALLEDAATIGRLPPEFENAARALHAVAALFLLVCETGPVSTGTRQ